MEHQVALQDCHRNSLRQNTRMLKALYIMEPLNWPRIYGPDQQAQITQMVEVLSPVLSKEEALKRPELLQQMDVLLSGWGGPTLDKNFLTMAPRLKALFYGAGSVRHMLSPEFWDRKIALTTANAANAIPVAEFTLAHILLGMKRALILSVETKKSRTFSRLKIPLAGSFGSTVGLVSLSTVGRLVLQRLATFDMKVIAYDPTVTPTEAAALNVELVELDALFARSDVVSLHAPLLPATTGIITGALLASMKPGATFINTARGAIVRENEMIEVLSTRPDLTAIIDVTYPEPPESISKLFDLPNVVLTPHIAGSVENECRRMGQLMTDELRCYLANEPMKARITRAQAESMA
jgi:phosphoglycerate dehydrogenase-like enzyme